MPTSVPGIELRELSRHFGRTRAVDDVSFQVTTGQVLGYIGPNGAGKTTSMRILATLDLPTAGDAYIDGFSVVDDPERVRARLGFLPDDFGTYPHVLVHEYLDFFARAHGLRGQQRMSAVDRVLEFTHLDQIADKETDALSKGMRQRLGLGRALVHDPPVLVLDEPAAGLDPRARVELREMIQALAQQGKSILISSHILSELAEMCDTVAILEQGRLLDVGHVETMRQRPAETHTLMIRLLDDAAPVAQWLSARDDVCQVRAARNQVVCQHTGDLQAEASLLRALVSAGFSVVAFGRQEQTLEEVFLQVTRGRVQ